MKKLLDLFFTFAKVGVMTFGGGYAMLPILQREVVEKKGWTTEEQLADYFAVGQCTPGIISVNVGTFIGNSQAGVLGGIVATLGVVFPSLIIISALTGLILTFAENPYVINAFAGIRVCVCVLILNAVLKLGKSAIKDALTLLIFLAVFACAFFFDLSPIVYVLIAGLTGVVYNVLRWRQNERKGA